MINMDDFFICLRDEDRVSGTESTSQQSELSALVICMICVSR